MDEDRTVAMSCRKKRRIPVGKAVYPVLRRGDYVYVDKTGFIPLLETFFPTNEGTLYLNFPKNLHSNTGTGDYFPKKVISS